MTDREGIVVRCFFIIFFIAVQVVVQKIDTINSTKTFHRTSELEFAFFDFEVLVLLLILIFKLSENSGARFT